MSAVNENKRQLRCGHTTGSCAAAAALAAAYMLLTGRKKEDIRIKTPKGIWLELPVREIEMGADEVSCAIEKDGGDDPDVTSGSLIYARVSLRSEAGIGIDGGEGVGRVSKPGLDQPVGAAAINSVPRRMITEGLEELCAALGYDGGLSVLISVPGGRELAQKTFNPRLGILGGISILGTTGIVEPMSEQAILDTIEVELRQRRAMGQSYALLTPGNYGSDYIRRELGLDTERAVLISNFVGESLDICKELGFSGILLVGHIGKLVKIAAGMLNTHSRYGDPRMNIIAAQAGALGLPKEKIAQLLECVACDEAVDILKSQGLEQECMDRIGEKIAFQMDLRVGGTVETAAVMFSKLHGTLAATSAAKDLLQHIKEE